MSKYLRKRFAPISMPSASFLFIYLPSTNFRDMPEKASSNSGFIPTIDPAVELLSSSILILDL